MYQMPAENLGRRRGMWLNFGNVGKRNGTMSVASEGISPTY